MEPIECAGFTFMSDFDSGNILRTELVNKKESRIIKPTSYLDEPDIEFNIWTKPDCSGTAYENCNRTWFYFGVRANNLPHGLVKVNLVDLNKQTKMYSQGMVPVTRTIPGNKCNWERVRDRITFTSDDTSFMLSFRFFTPENVKSIQYFAFTYPYTYAELQNHLLQLDHKYLTIPGPAHIDDIYYVRECVCKSLEGRRIDLITISSYHNITFEKEPRLKNLFLDKTVNRPFKFHDKKVIFVSARVHPGETPASFVFNGFLNLLLNRDNIYSIALRRLYVFKLIPFLNPDGVVHGHYRTDTRGVNLNRLYLNPSFNEHPSVYAARSLIRYHHHGVEQPDEIPQQYMVTNHHPSIDSISSSNCSSTKLSKEHINQKISSSNKYGGDSVMISNSKSPDVVCTTGDTNTVTDKTSSSRVDDSMTATTLGDTNDDDVKPGQESGLFLYIDLHGHASKKGIFMYGNHFKDQSSNIECMLLPKIMSINSSNFHFFACNFTERNMYLKDKRDGLSREGSGRVAVLKLTGLIRSYTLECNYNTGRIVNPLPAPLRDGSAKPVTHNIVPPKYTPHVYEEAGKAIGPSILDLTGDNPNSRLPNSEFRTLNNMREWLKWYLIGQLGSPSEHAKSLSQIQRPGGRKTPFKALIKPSRIPSHTIAVRKTDRKENLLIQNKTQPSCSNTLTSRPSKTVVRSKFTTPTISSNLKTKDSVIQNIKTTSGDFNNKFKRQSLMATNVATIPTTTNKTSGFVTNRKCNTVIPDIRCDPLLIQESEMIPKQEPKRLRTATSTLGGTSSTATPRPLSTSICHRTNESNRIKIRDICLLKTDFSKKFATSKYDNPSTSTTKETIDKDLVIEWKEGINTEECVGLKKKEQKIVPKYQVPVKHSPIKTDSKRLLALKKMRMRKPLRRLTTTTDLTYGLIKNKKRKKKKAKFI